MSITPSEWARISPSERRRAIGDMTQIQAADLYAALSSDRRSGPRLTRSEWNALGYVGQQRLIISMPDWEADIVASWHESGFVAAPAELAQSPQEEKDVLDNGSWAPKRMHAWLFLSSIMPPLGMAMFAFNFWKPGRFAQSVGLLSAGLFMLFLGYPMVIKFIEGMTYAIIR